MSDIRKHLPAGALCVAVLLPFAPSAALGQAQRPPATSASRNTAIENAARQAEALAPKDLRGAMAILERAIAAAPTDPAAAKLYLQLGRLKRSFERYHAARENESVEAFEKRIAEDEAYAKSRPGEFWYNEIGGSYLYNGFHFVDLQKRFPAHPWAIEAAYEMTWLSLGGECEGYVTCYIHAGFTPVLGFLQKHPATKFSAEAVQRANEAFRSNLWGATWKSEFAEIKDPHKDVEGYEAAQLKRLVQEYEDLAPTLQGNLRASAHETIAYYRARFGEHAQARKLYEWIVKEAPTYERLTEVRKALAALK